MKGEFDIRNILDNSGYGAFGGIRYTTITFELIFA